MLYLKATNSEDWEKEWEFITNQPSDENGFLNDYYQVDKDTFLNKVLPELFDYANGVNLPENYVPETYFFLWDDDTIVGLFHLRHMLNDALRNGSGHIGYGIKKEYRGKGYASEGLRLAVEEARKIIPEDEVYLGVNKNNPASLRVQMKNGAYIHHEDELKYYTRIPLGK